jgi:glycosyltransferase involved in cell wall biosynthesis
VTAPLKILYYCPVSFGGIAEYGNRQCEALAEAGAVVIMLCPSDFPFDSPLYQRDRSLTQDASPRQSRLRNRIRIFKRLLDDAKTLDRTIHKGGFRKVLFASYGEYLAPLWAWRFRAHARRGVKFGAIAHDPVRDYVVGPLWWHRWSIAEGYSFLSEAFVHEPIELDTVRAMKTLRTTLIPIGPFSFPEPSKKRQELRSELQIPQDAPLFLSFGHLRNNKNLHLIIEALKEVKNAWLLVAGTEAPPNQTLSSDYQNLAAAAGVADRCRWRISFLQPSDVSNYFNASDYVLLTYAKSFRSASGVLSVAAWFQKPIIASAGESSLLSLVRNYQLGCTVEADSAAAIVEGMNSQMHRHSPVRWDDYLHDNGWQTNANKVIEAMAS